MFPVAVIDVTDAVTLIGALMDLVTDPAIFPFLVMTIITGAGLTAYRKIAKSSK